MGTLKAARFYRRIAIWTIAAVALVALGVVLATRLSGVRLSTEQVQTAVIATLQSESPESILVTGALTVGVTTVSSNTRYLLPGVVTLDLGTTEATARVPGTVSYGIDVSQLTPDQIWLEEDVLYVRTPDIRVISVEPDLSSLQLETRVGWARTHAGSGAEATRDAVSKITGALREQGERHVAEALQPRINTATAITDVVSRALLTADIRVRAVRVEVAPGVVIEKTTADTIDEATEGLAEPVG